GGGVGGGGAWGGGGVAHHRHDLVERPAQVDRGRAGGEQRRVGALERGVGGIGAQRERHAVGGGCTDQRRAAHLHGGDRAHGVVDRRQPHCGETVWRRRLVDDANGHPVGLEPDRAHGLAVDFHGGTLNALCPVTKAITTSASVSEPGGGTAASDGRTIDISLIGNCP